MRAITVRQPWAWAIVHGGKDVENRTRNIAGAYRGPVAIHAGQQYDPDAWEHPALIKAWMDTGGDDFDYGLVVGVVDLVDVHHDLDNRCWEITLDETGQCSPWAMPDHHHLVLANPRTLATPIPWRGQLGLWKVPADLEARIREQVTK
jgi:hypothetical protein